MTLNNLNQLHHWCSISAAAAVLETFLKCASLNYPSFEIHLATLPDVLCHFSGCTSISTVTLPMVQDQAGGAGGPGGPGGLQGGVAPSPSPSLNLQFLDLTDCVRLMDQGNLLRDIVIWSVAAWAVERMRTKSVCLTTSNIFFFFISTWEKKHNF